MGVVVFCLLEIAINTMEEYEDVRILLFGRVLGGISTSLLFTSFESWMVTEHRNRKFPEEWLAQTFAFGQMGNGVVAILAGFTADIAVSYMGNIGPFRTAVLVTTVVLGHAASNENVGSRHQQRFLTFQQLEGIWGLQNTFGRVYPGIFEGAMYTFVFNWVPAMHHVGGLTLNWALFFFLWCASLKVFA